MDIYRRTVFFQDTKSVLYGSTVLAAANMNETFKRTVITNRNCSRVTRDARLYGHCGPRGFLRSFVLQSLNLQCFCFPAVFLHERC